MLRANRTADGLILIAGPTPAVDLARHPYPNSVRMWEMENWRRSAAAATVFDVDVRTSSTPAPGLRLVLLAIVIVMALTADTRFASAAPGGAEGESAPAPSAGQTPFDRQGMWIWYVDRSDGGDVGRIVARAKRVGIGTLYIKAGDGGSVWSQFSSSLVGALHRGGLDVCAWQFVYGDSPVAEAKVGRRRCAAAPTAW